MVVNQRCRVVNNRTPRARAVGTALREARLEHKLGLREFAKSIDRDPSLLSRWETGDRTPPATEVARILGKLGVIGRRYEEIIELALGADDSRWLATSVPEQHAQLAALLDLERTASVITDVSPLIVPGLLQTSQYARAIMTEGGVRTDEISTRVAIRAGRREVLTRDEPVRLLAYLGEAALRQRIGSREIMVEQIQHLLTMAAMPNVEIRVIPFDSGWHPGLVGLFVLIESATEPPVAHLEVRDSGLFLHTSTDVAAYRQAAAKVSERAMSIEDSLAVIALAKTGWEAA
ncbi:MAG TPA: helix-turn-helix transcriptional regulator [Pseudonocardiaceae bacterium]|jgi:transcriptional regulator with XRE-family HTH domain|nr:helix-turn-helix transcriptional regulator [Pseudonocardiaceae bacterium]